MQRWRHRARWPGITAEPIEAAGPRRAAAAAGTAVESVGHHVHAGAAAAPPTERAAHATQATVVRIIADVDTPAPAAHHRCSSAQRALMVAQPRPGPAAVLPSHLAGGRPPEPRRGNAWAWRWRVSCARQLQVQACHDKHQNSAVCEGM